MLCFFSAGKAAPDANGVKRLRRRSTAIQSLRYIRDDCRPNCVWADLDMDLDNSRQEPEAITATSGCALRKSGEPTLEGRYCVRLSN